MKTIAGPLVSCFILTSFFFNNNISIQKKEKALPKVSEEQQYTIYLTFDDGPLEGSEDINNAVLEEKININVFVVGVHEQRKRRMKRFYNLYLQNPFIEVGNHSYSHAHNHYKKFYNNSQKGWPIF